MNAFAPQLSFLYTVLNSISWQYILPVVIALIFIFIVWNESIKDGFDDKRVLDMLVISISLTALVLFAVLRWWMWLTTYYPLSPVLKIDVVFLCLLAGLLPFFGPIVYLTKKWSWSVFRILDIFTQAWGFILILMFALLYSINKADLYFNIGIVSLVAYLVFFQHRGYRFVSGVSSALFAYFSAAAIIFFYPKPGYLLVFTILITIASVTIYLIRRRLFMTNMHLPKEFINKLKDLLLKKKANLEHQEDLLRQEDPYLQVGRTEGNSEDMDEAILEDSAKELTDIKMEINQEEEKDVKKALESIDVGTYGTCVICGNKIDKARLEVFPEADKCFDCSQKLS